MKLRKRILAFFAAGAAVSVGSIAGAAWVASGTGSGYAKATSAEALTTLGLEVETVLAAELYPGGETDLVVHIDNTNDYPVTITSISQDDGTTEAPKYVISDQGTACTDATSANPTGVSFEGGTVDWDVPANESATFTLTDVVSMSNDSANGCQGATFTIPVALAGASNASDAS